MLFATDDGHDHDGVNSKKLTPAAGIGADSVTTVAIKDANVTSAKLGIDSVTSIKILDGAVTTAKLGADAVTGEKIVDNAINSEHITAGAIDTAHIGLLQVTTATIAEDAITGAKLADNAVDSDHIAAGAIDTAHIGALQVTAEKIAANAVETAKIKDAQVTNAKLDDLARGSIKVGGADDKVTDLVAKTSGYILVGDDTDLASVAVSGDVTLDATGAVTIGATKVTTAMLGLTATPNAKAIVAAHEATIPVTGNGNLALTIGTTTETNTLPVPTFAGQEISISADTVGAAGSRVITVASSFDGTNNTITFDAAGEFVLLRGIKVGATFAWRLVANVGATLTAET